MKPTFHVPPLAWLIFVLTLGLPFALLAAKPAAADGAFAVDSTDFGKPGECKVESWMSAAANRDIIAALAPACVVKLGIPVEFSSQLQRSRSDEVWSTSGTAKVKTNIIPLEKKIFGVGIAGGISWDLITGAYTGGFIYVPVTFALREDLRLNVNGGWQYDNVNKIPYLTWGASFEWEFVKKFTLIGEVYGQSGRLPATEPDDAPAPNSIREPRTQLGLRFTPKENVDIDVIWGRNITGECATG